MTVWYAGWNDIAVSFHPAFDNLSHFGPFQSHCVHLLIEHNGTLILKIDICIGGWGEVEGGRQAEV